VAVRPWTEAQGRSVNRGTVTLGLPYAELLPVSAAANALGISETSLRRAIAAGLRTCTVQTGGQLMVPMRAAVAFFENGGAAAPAQPAEVA
jgi:hypothetical protein